MYSFKIKYKNLETEKIEITIVNASNYGNARNRFYHKNRDSELFILSCKMLPDEHIKDIVWKTRL